MRPLVKPGDHLLVEFGAVPTRRGQVVLFERDGSHVAHRIVHLDRRSTPARVRAKGDAEALADAPIDLDDVVGLVVATRTGGGGAPRSLGLDGRGAAVVAALSWGGDRVVRVVRRATRRLPVAVGRPITSVTTGVMSIATRSCIATGAWLTGNPWRKEVIRR
jgi:hypothetical protein